MAVEQIIRRAVVCAVWRFSASNKVWSSGVNSIAAVVTLALETGAVNFLVDNPVGSIDFPSFLLSQMSLAHARQIHVPRYHCFLIRWTVGNRDTECCGSTGLPFRLSSRHNLMYLEEVVEFVDPFPTGGIQRYLTMVIGLSVQAQE